MYQLSFIILIDRVDTYERNEESLPLIPVTRETKSLYR